MSAKIIPFPTRESEASASIDDLDTVLMAADEMIARGSREMLAHVLKGMPSDVVLATEGQKLKHFGALAHLSLGAIESAIARLLDDDLLRIETSLGKPILVHSTAGWERVKVMWVERLLCSFAERLRRNDLRGLYAEVGRVNREVKLAVLDRICDAGEPRFVPLLESWREREDKPVKRRIADVLDTLSRAAAR